MRKPQAFFGILAFVAASGILATAIVARTGMKDGIAKYLFGAALLSALIAPFLYWFVAEEAGKEESGSRLLSLVNNVPGIVYRGHKDWSLSFIGTEVEPVTGYTAREFTRGAVKWKEIVHPDEVAWLEKTFRDAIKEKAGNLRVEYRIRHKDGGIRWIADRRQIVYDKRGAFDYVDGLLLDVTARKKSEMMLQESEQRFRAIADTASDGIVTVNDRGNVVTFNRAAERIFGYAFSEIEGKNVTTLIPDRHRSAHEKGLGRYLESGDSRIIGRTVELDGLRKDGTEIPIELSLAEWRSKGSRYFSAIVRDVTQRRKTEVAFIRLSMAVEQAVEAIVITDKEGSIEYVNPAFERITGYSREEAVGRNARILKSGKHDETFYKNMWDTITQGEPWRGCFTNKRKDGTLYEEEAVISPVRDGGGRIVNYVAGKRDISREVILQKQVQTAQRMESVGTLAGGIAHDFNNALTGIFGFSEMLRMKIGGDPDASNDLDMIRQCAEHAATLTRQLLTFARRQVIDPVNLDLNVVVTDIIRLLRKVIGEQIEIKTFLSKDLPVARLDRGQVEQVLMNLCLNARDAMPAGGQLLVETAAVMLDDEYVRDHPYAAPVRHVSLVVSDTGIGMDEGTCDRVFEPFFTTKAVGKGTGLGLSTVYGIVKQNKGFILVYSEPGKGTSMKVYFPAVDSLAAAVPEKSREAAVRGGTETILLAEDEESIRVLSERILAELGYNVLVGRNGEETVDLFYRNQDIALAVLDVVMPRKGGKEAYEEMRRGKPELKVIFTSGYSADAVHESYVLMAGVPFLPKPYSPAALARKVREVLDAA
jgi:PAS domain S-box-containing protein